MAVTFCARAIVLFLIGGFVAWLYSDETVRFKVFLLGMGAPAMLAGYVTASANTSDTPGASSSPPLMFIQTVHAQAAPKADDLKHFTLPAPTATEQVYEGLTGARPKNVWFVIAGSFLSLDSARDYSRKINRGFPGFHADVYAPYRDNPSYAVVIGAQLTQQDAKTLRDKAMNAGLQQTYYKTFSNLPYP
jgi:cell division protein FtsN